jgi:hypothetical protein
VGKTKKISVTVNASLLDEIKRQRPDATVSFLINEAREQHLKRESLSELLDEMDARSPMSEKGRRKGDALWEQVQSFWTQGPSPR